MAPPVSQTPVGLGPTDFNPLPEADEWQGPGSNTPNKSLPFAHDKHQDMTHQPGLRQHHQVTDLAGPDIATQLKEGPIPSYLRGPFEEVGNFLENNVPGWDLSKYSAEDIVALMNGSNFAASILPSQPAMNPLPGPISQAKPGKKIPVTILDHIKQYLPTKGPDDVYSFALSIYNDLANQIKTNNPYALGDIVNEYFDETPGVKALPEYRGSHFLHSVNLGLDQGLSPEDAMKNAAMAHGLATQKQLQPGVVSEEVMALKDAIAFADLDQEYQPTVGHIGIRSPVTEEQPQAAPTGQPHIPQARPGIGLPTNPINQTQPGTRPQIGAAQKPSLTDHIKDTASSAWNSIKDFASDAWSGAKDLAESAWSGAKDLASSAWDSITDFATGMANAFHAGIGWIGDKIRENGMKDHMSILEGRDKEKGIQSYTAQEAYNGIRDAFGFGDDKDNDSGGGNDGNSGTGNSSSSNDNSEPAGADRDGPGGAAV